MLIIKQLNYFNKYFTATKQGKSQPAITGLQMNALGRKVLPAATEIFAVLRNDFPDTSDGNR